jgi:putative transposase
MARGFVYLAVVLDWFSRRVLSWRLSITMEAAFCVATLEDALARHGKPDIFNTDQRKDLVRQSRLSVFIRNPDKPGRVRESIGLVYAEHAVSGKCVHQQRRSNIHEVPRSPPAAWAKIGTPAG